MAARLGKSRQVGRRREILEFMLWAAGMMQFYLRIDANFIQSLQMSATCCSTIEKYALHSSPHRLGPSPGWGPVRIGARSGLGPIWALLAPKDMILFIKSLILMKNHKIINKNIKIVNLKILKVKMWFDDKDLYS